MSYDNTNRGALWYVPGSKHYDGRANVSGTDYTLQVVPCKSGPSHIAILHNREELHAAKLWKPKNADAKSVATGVFDDLGKRMNVFRADMKHEQSPGFTVSFRDVEDQTPHPPQEDETQVPQDAPF